jgi:hypothetical protein
LAGSILRKGSGRGGQRNRGKGSKARATQRWHGHEGWHDTKEGWSWHDWKDKQWQDHHRWHKDHWHQDHQRGDQDHWHKDKYSGWDWNCKAEPEEEQPQLKERAMSASWQVFIYNCYVLDGFVL